MEISVLNPDKSDEMFDAISNIVEHACIEKVVDNGFGVRIDLGLE